MAKWIVYDLDVWGNEEDGWDINDFVAIGEFDDDNREDVITWLYLNEFITDDDPDKYVVDSQDEYHIDISRESDGYPLFLFERKLPGYGYRTE